ncbi:MAG: acetate/propionate family kinase [Proteobacteria bacterium]|nr:acetate/propionate family kinase [Pseudomonadota bacterium]
MTDGILVLNAGSSSVKFALYAIGAADPSLRLRGQIERIGHDAAFIVQAPRGTPPRPVAAADHDQALGLLLDWLAREGAGIVVRGAGHRVVHGGAERAAPVRLTSAIIAELSALEPLAPLHQPHNLAAIRALVARLPALPQVACFDTSFHATQPTVARRLGLPLEYEERGLRRYGFHGLSYEYIVHALPQVSGATLPRRLIIAHLGNGASLCAVRDGRSVATTMGFSTLDGLLMGTRCGAIDPGILLHLLREDGMDHGALSNLLYDRSGLLGVSGLSSDMRTLLESPEPRAKAAVDLFCYRATRELGSLAAALGGLDAVVFTGGIGEHAAAIRERICRDAAWLDLEFDAAANAAGGPRLSRPDSRVAAWVVPTNEELMIARHTRDLLELNP